MKRLVAIMMLASLAACGGAVRSGSDTSDASSVGASTSVTAMASTPSVRPTTRRPVSPGTIPRTPWTTVVGGCPSGSPKGEVVVLAASSLANIFPSVEDRLRAAYPCVTGIRVSYGSSSVLAAQILNGSPADVFVSASESPMASVVDAGLASAPVKFASNLAEIMVGINSPIAGKVSTLSDLLDEKNPGIKVGLCVATAPCGSLANTVLSNARIAYTDNSLTRAKIADTETPSVEDLVTKIQLGELDAGIVYHSDCVYAQRFGFADCVAIPLAEAGSAVNSLNVYVAAALNDKSLSRDVVGFIASASFRSYLQSEFGFYAP